MAVISPISSCLGSHQAAPRWRKWEPKSKKEGGGTLFLHHPCLMKLDWDIPDPAHSDGAITIAFRGEVEGILRADPWARNHAWGLAASYGGVNAYLLSMKAPLYSRQTRSSEWVQRLEERLLSMKVDPFYIKNIKTGVSGRWSWCSRVWPKGWRPGESWTGAPLGICNPQGARILPSLMAEYEYILECYQVCSPVTPPEEVLLWGEIDEDPLMDLHL